MADLYTYWQFWFGLFIGAAGSLTGAAWAAIDFRRKYYYYPRQ